MDSLTNLRDSLDSSSRQAAGGAKRDEAVDEDFRSGVYLGNGLISMILGLLPGKVLKIMEVSGARACPHTTAR